MSIVFQPKIIIGSVIGIIASAIGIIAVFFPSLFNLETKKIADYNYTLNNLDDAKRLIKFLQDHQDSIVHLDLTYIEQQRYRDAIDKNGNVIIDWDDKFSNEILPDGALDTGVKKENLNDSCSGELEGKESYGMVDNDGHIFIKSEFKCLPFFNDFNFLRKKGDIGIWIPGKGEHGEDDKNFRIIITENSRNNSLFKWSIKDREKNRNEMQLSGTFFVNKFLDAHESDYGSDKESVYTIFTMSPQWIARYNGLEDIGKENMTIIELDPLSKKEIESKKY